MSFSRLAFLYVKCLSEILKLNCDNLVFLDLCGVNVAPLSQAFMMFSKTWHNVSTIMSRGEGEVHLTGGGHGKNTGIIENKSDISTHHWYTRNFIRAEENMKSYRQQIFTLNCKYSETAFSWNYQSDDCTLLQNVPNPSYTHSPDTNLRASSVSGIGRDKGEWQGSSSSPGDSSLQHPAIRNNPPGFSVIFCSQRWV